jgi:hypothetical protein
VWVIADAIVDVLVVVPLPAAPLSLLSLIALQFFFFFFFFFFSVVNKRTGRWVRNELSRFLPFAFEFASIEEKNKN